MYSLPPAAPGLPPWQARGNYTGINDRTAYISVPARQSFSSSSSLPPHPTYIPSPLQANVPPPPPAMPVPSTSASPTRKKVVWSEQVRDYVQRSFAIDNAIEGISKSEIEVKLKKIITEATSSGNLDNVNWAQLPLPQQMILEERSRSVSIPSPPAAISWSPQSVMHVSQGSFPPQPESLRKRKSSELTSEAGDSSVLPPWRNSKIGTSLEDRVSFASLIEKRLKVDHQGSGASKSHVSVENRKKRFGDLRSGSYSPQNGNLSRTTSPPPDPTSGPIVGRSQKLEKNYFRLTSAPNPEDVRPLEVLEKTLDLLKKKWKENANYSYICDQFKSLRQDLTVQHIKNDFTTNVYEIHARIALEKGDLGEYNQCQTQLRALYKQDLGGHPIEFKAYRILYFIHTCNRTDMNDVLSDLTTTDKSEPAINHALQVRSALALGNYHKFFKLYLEVPNMGAYLMDMFVARERIAALASICKS
jgi:SAC3 family protein LENG8/THP3